MAAISLKQLAAELKAATDDIAVNLERAWAIAHDAGASAAEEAEAAGLFRTQIDRLKVMGKDEASPIVPNPAS